MNGWWYVASAMFVISTVLWLLVGTRLAAANPATRLPWLGRPPNKPRGVRLLQTFATVTMVTGMNFVVDGFGPNRSDYDILWGVPFALVAGMGLAVPYIRHNRRVRRAALRSAESQQTGY